MLAMVVFTGTPLCKKCLADRHADLPAENRPTSISFVFPGSSVSSIGSSVTTTTQYIAGIVTEKANQEA